MKIELIGSKKEKKKTIKYLSKNKIQFSELKESVTNNRQTESNKITFNANRTDAEWIRWLDKTALKYVPKWYEFLNWVVLIGLLKFLSETSDNWKLKLIYGISMAGMFWYLQGYFYSLEFDGIPFIKKESIKRIISFTISGLLAIGTYIFLQSVIPLFKA